MSALVISLSQGRPIHNSGNVNNTAIKESKSDSPINCFTKSFLPAAIYFRTPTSLALFDARAVDKFIKLIQAISCINPAINNNIERNDGLTVLSISASYPGVV